MIALFCLFLALFASPFKSKSGLKYFEFLKRVRSTLFAKQA